MAAMTGQILPFADYVGQTRSPRGEPTLWKHAEIEAALSTLPSEERGTLALASASSPDPATFLPGLSLTMQVVGVGNRQQQHSHFHWHLFFVRAGHGTVTLGGDRTTTRIEAGDVLLVPPWYLHAFANVEGREPLVIQAIQCVR
jgi:gentisate 1,2-dioxygenase